MRHGILKQDRPPASPRRRDDASGRRQYAPPVLPVALQADAQHFRRQAELCQRLQSSLHQPELVDLLARLQEEYEATATRLEAAGASVRNRSK